MPNHKSAEKRDRQNARKNAVNTANRGQLRTQLKKLRTVLEQGNQEQALALLPKTVSDLDRAVQKGIIHRNAASRQKSRLTMRINKLSAK